jgi:hypothetical protein
VHLLHGGMNIDERRESIRRFEDEGQFLISTEAGGEGLNLHRRCNVMVNYDWPWNPMRLVQRVGRLYRYGQQRRVVVFNMFVPQTLDGQILSLLYTRIAQVVTDMATVGNDFRPGLEDEILGLLSEVLDVEAILETANHATRERTEQELEEALRRARAAVEKQQELFRYAHGYDPTETRNELRVDSRHLESFFEGMMRLLDIPIVERSHQGRVLTVRLPEQLQKQLGSSRSVLRLTLDRELAAGRADIEFMDLDSRLIAHLVSAATQYSFGGRCAGLTGLDGRALLVAILRWQNDQGYRMRQELATVILDDDALHERDDSLLAEWLLSPAEDGQVTAERSQADSLVQRADARLDLRLADVSGQFLHPESSQKIVAAWISGSTADGVGNVTGAI